MKKLLNSGIAGVSQNLLFPEYGQPASDLAGTRIIGGMRVRKVREEAIRMMAEHINKP